MDFETIYSQYFRDVVFYINSLANNSAVAEEIAQETFFKALKAIDRFDGTRDIKVWLFTIAKNTYFSYCNKSKRCTEYDQLNEVPAEDVSITEKLENEEDAFKIHQFIHGMSEPYKEVFNLRVFGELSFEKIGELFGKSSGWARVTYHRAKKQIIQYLEEMYDERN